MSQLFENATGNGQSRCCVCGVLSWDSMMYIFPGETKRYCYKHAKERESQILTKEGKTDE